jgi:hypothetical protein
VRNLYFASALGMLSLALCFGTNRLVAPAAAGEAKRQEVEPPVKDAAELIRAKLVGVWRWGEDLDYSIRFAQDGTFLDKGTSGETGRGKWSVDENGTIQLSDDDNFWLPVVTMNLKDDKIAIGIATEKGPMEVVAQRFTGFGMTPAEIDRYVEKQIEDLAPARPGFSRTRIYLRREIADNLKALGPAAIDAVPALNAVVLVDEDTLVKRKIVKALGEIGGPQGIYAIGMTLLQTRNPEVFAAAEDALVKLLPAIRKGPRTDKSVIGPELAPLDPEKRAAYLKRKAKMTPFSSTRMSMDEAIFLFQLNGAVNEPVSSAIENAWKSSGFSKAGVASEIKRRHRRAVEEAWAKAYAAEAAWQERKAEEQQEVADKLNKLERPSPFGPPVPWKYVPDPPVGRKWRILGDKPD